MNTIGERVSGLAAGEPELCDFVQQSVGHGNHRRRLDALFKPVPASVSPAGDQRPEPQLGDRH